MQTEEVRAVFGATRPSTPLISVSTATDANEWNAFVSRHSEATGYHIWQWRYVFERAFRHQTEYLIARRGSQVVGILPLVVFRSWLFGRFAVSLPFVNYGGIVADDAETAAQLLGAATEIARRKGCKHVELRHTQRQFDGLPHKQHKVAMRLPLAASVETMWSNLDRKVRNQIRKAEKSGLTCRTGTRELLPDFYRVFAENMRDLGTPVYSPRLFDEVFEQFPQETRVFVVKHERTTVAAGITYRHRGSVEVPWASSLASHRSMCPNNLLYWRIIEWAAQERVDMLDFGRSTPGEGTYHFKRQWGAEPRPLFWEYALLTRSGVPDQSPKNPTFNRAIAIWKRLPVSVASKLGPPIVRSIP